MMNNLSEENLEIDLKPLTNKERSKFEEVFFEKMKNDSNKVEKMLQQTSNPSLYDILEKQSLDGYSIYQFVPIKKSFFQRVKEFFSIRKM